MSRRRVRSVARLWPLRPIYGVCEVTSTKQKEKILTGHAILATVASANERPNMKNSKWKCVSNALWTCGAGILFVRLRSACVLYEFMIFKIISHTTCYTKNYYLIWYNRTAHSHTHTNTRTHARSANVHFRFEFEFAWSPRYRWKKKHCACYAVNFEFIPMAIKTVVVRSFVVCATNEIHLIWFMRLPCGFGTFRLTCIHL